MARKDEISSTEKLLDLIRDKTPSPSTIKETGPAVTTSHKSGLFKSLTFQKPIGIGVEIGNDYIKVAKVNRISDKSFELLDYDTISIEPIDFYDAPHLARALAGILSRFCTGMKSYEIWCCMASARIETRCIHIPKLPKKQIPNAVFWTFSKEVAFSEKEMLLDFRVLGDVNENGTTKTQVMTFTIPIAQTQTLQRLFARTTYSLSGISIVPFAIQNLLKTGVVQVAGRNTCCLFIGRDWSRITIYADGNLILSRGVKAGIHSMIDALANQYRPPSTDDTSPVPVMANHEETSPGEQDAYYDTARDDFYRFLDSDNGANAAAETEVGRSADIFPTILSAIERLVKQVERTIAHFSMHFKRSSVSEILISGRVTESAAIISHISDQLGLPVNVLNPFPQSNSFTQKVTAPDLPVVKDSFVPAIGIGLSSNDLTPNFLFTYRHREKRDRARKVRIGISAACIGFLVMLLCGFLGQESRIKAKASQVARLTQKRDSFNIPLSSELVMALYAKVSRKRDLITNISRRYYSSAVMAEVTRFIPANIKLIALRADMDPPSKDAQKKSGSTLVIEGIITGEKIRFESDLVSYMLTMKASPLFKKPIVKSKRLQYLDDQPVLRFSIQFELA